MNKSKYITFWVQALPIYTNSLRMDGIEWRLIPISSLCSSTPVERYKNLAECYANLNMGNFDGLSAFVDFPKLERSLYNDIFEKGAPAAWQINLDFSEFEVNSESGFSLFPLIACSYTDISRLESRSDWWEEVQKEMKNLGFSQEKIEKAKEEFFAIKWPIFSAEAIRDNLYQERVPSAQAEKVENNAKEAEEELLAKGEEYDDILQSLKSKYLNTCLDSASVFSTNYVAKKEMNSQKIKDGRSFATFRRPTGPRGKLSDEQKKDIIDSLLKRKNSILGLARLYNVSPPTITRVASMIPELRPNPRVSGRIKHGLNIARRKGRPVGRQSKFSEEQKNDIIDKYFSSKNSVQEIASIYRVCPTTIYKIIRAARGEKGNQ